jgi:polyhydroxybutyrate depolymerase
MTARQARLLTRVLICILALAVAGQAAAAGCGGAVACAVAGGVYHARAPDGPPAGAVLFLHGWGGTGVGVIGDEALVAPLLERGYVVVAPSGMPRREGAVGGRWNARGGPGRDDVALLRAVADDAAARFGFPRDKVLAAGFSGGGMMVWRVACIDATAFAAYAPVAGLLWRPLPAACAGPIRLLHTHGWSDAVVPLEGRSVGGGQITQGDLFAGLDLMRRAAGCRRDDPDAYERSGDLLIRTWRDCSPGAELELALHPGGHTVPAGWAGLVLDWFESAPGEGG